MKFHKLGLELDMPGGACVLFDSTRMEHSTEECGKVCTPGEVTRMGVALHCRQGVSGLYREGGQMRLMTFTIVPMTMSALC